MVKGHPYRFPLTPHNVYTMPKKFGESFAELVDLERPHLTLSIKQNRTTVKYELSHPNAASSPIGTMRSLLPLPITRTTPCCKFIFSMVSVTNSVTRNPVAYSNSNIALSRNSSGISTSGVI